MVSSPSWMSQSSVALLLRRNGVESVNAQLKHLGIGGTRQNKLRTKCETVSLRPAPDVTSSSAGADWSVSKRRASIKTSWQLGSFRPPNKATWPA